MVYLLISNDFQDPQRIGTKACTEYTLTPAEDAARLEPSTGEGVL